LIQFARFRVILKTFSRSGLLREAAFGCRAADGQRRKRSCFDNHGLSACLNSARTWLQPFIDRQILGTRVLVNNKAVFLRGAGWRGMGKQMAFAVDRSRTIISALIHGRSISAIDIAWLRREVFADGEVSRESADELFAVENSDAAKSPEWTAFFVEMITEHVVWQNRPTGIVNEAQAEWLIKRADAAASVDALAVLVNVLAEAHRAPAWFLAAVRARAGRGWRGVNEALASAGAVA
jgi:hypothetical protein